MLSYLFLLFTVVPLVELYILIRAGQIIGAFNIIAIVIFTGIFGAFLAKLEGLRVFYSLQREINEGKMPASVLIDGFLILIGAVLLITPGIITDLIGFILIIPFTRQIFKFWLKNFIKKTIDNRENVIIVNNFIVNKEESG